ncbi:MAG TPA: response regulator [Nitrospirota bacterium]
MKKILVVDDEDNLRALFQGELADEGYQVVTARTGEEAVELVEKENPDLITMDIKMPGMGGIEALRNIREKHPSIPIIMLTAYSEFKNDFDVWAADAYVVKSSDLGDLKQKVRYFLET